MPLVAAICVSCGGTLKVESTLDAAICPYCNTPYIVEKAIKQYKITNNIKADVVNIYESDMAYSKKNYGKTTPTELANMAQNAVRIDVSDHVRYLAEDAAKIFVQACKYEAEKGRRQYRSIAGSGSFDYLLFVDRSAIREGKRTIVEWCEFSVGLYSEGEFYGKNYSEENIGDLDDFIFALKIMLKKAGLTDFTVWKKKAASPPRVRVKYFGLLGIGRSIESVPVPSYYVIIEANW